MPGMNRQSGREISDLRDRYAVALAPPCTVAVRERMSGMTRTGWPARVDEGIGEILLHVLDELLAARGNAQGLHVRCRVADDDGITSAKRPQDVLLEAGNELSQSE